MPDPKLKYEFDAAPYGLQLYHCHVRPLAEHIAKGLYGTLIIDPKDRRDKADEMVMVMNGFDTNFDRANELYAANTIGFAYADKPIRVKRRASAFNSSVAAFLFGAGAGAIAQVIVQLAPSLREAGERSLAPRVVGGLLAGLALMFATGLLVSV